MLVISKRITANEKLGSTARQSGRCLHSLGERVCMCVSICHNLFTALLLLIDFPRYISSVSCSVSFSSPLPLIELMSLLTSPRLLFLDPPRQPALCLFCVLQRRNDLRSVTLENATCPYAGVYCESAAFYVEAHFIPKYINPILCRIKRENSAFSNVSTTGLLDQGRLVYDYMIKFVCCHVVWDYSV